MTTVDVSAKAVIELIKTTFASSFSVSQIIAPPSLPTSLTPRGLWNWLCDELSKRLNPDWTIAIEIPEIPVPSLPNVPAGPAVEGVDPAEVMRQIAEALNAAEALLNQQNLVINEGSVETTLYVKVGDLAGAQTTIKVSIAPKPYG